MKVIIIGDNAETNLLGIESIRKENKNFEILITEEYIESKKDDLIIIMKELEDYSFLGQKSLFLSKEINTKNIFFLKSFEDINVNISKIKLLINLFLS